MQTKALPGFREFYPADLALRTHIVRTWRTVATRYGFEEYDGPPLEPLELYTAKSGDEIVGQLYAFTDKGGREVALRPEMTPTLARMVAARANGLKKPIRWFAIPQLFRYERQQRGRLRESGSRAPSAMPRSLRSRST
jgi:histidyl-tRNA synthetase